MSLAEAGDNLKLDMSSHDATAAAEGASKEGDVYTFIGEMPPRPTFLWGKAVGQDACEQLLSVLYRIFKK